LLPEGFAFYRVIKKDCLSWQDFISFERAILLELIWSGFSRLKE
jgi:hypothetical protein